MKIFMKVLDFSDIFGQYTCEKTNSRGVPRGSDFLNNLSTFQDKQLKKNLVPECAAVSSTKLTKPFTTGPHCTSEHAKEVQKTTKNDDSTACNFLLRRLLQKIWLFWETHTHHEVPKFCQTLSAYYCSRNQSLSTHTPKSTTTNLVVIKISAIGRMWVLIICMQLVMSCRAFSTELQHMNVNQSLVGATCKFLSLLERAKKRAKNTLASDLDRYW